MEPDILGDTVLETIINNFACKEMRRLKLFVAEFLSKSTH